jgi:hypothetical protein
MRRMAVALMLAVSASVTLAGSANAVPSFTRQTGLTCNQCHITFSNVPDFTFTGKKFRLNGYRTPYVAEKIEAGEEGSLTGNRLVLGIQNIFSLRFRNNLLSQSKPASDASQPEPVAGPVTSQPGTSISWFYVGGIGEHFGLWNEFYLDTAGNVSSAATPFRLNGFDEYDLKFVFNPGYDNIVGFAITTQALDCLSGFCPFNSGAPLSQLQRGGIGNAHTSYVNLAAYTFIKDRLLLMGAVSTGEDNYSFSDGMNYVANVAYAFGNTDHLQLWYTGFVKAGNDGIPIVTSVNLTSDRDVTYGDAIRGVSALNLRTTDANHTHCAVASATCKAASYTPANTGDFVRTKQEIAYGFVDKGPHSLTTALGYNWNRETYDDGAEIRQGGVGFTARYMYDRTYGFQYGINKVTSNQFKDAYGVTHQITEPFNYGTITWLYRPAMNFQINVGMGVTTSLGQILDDQRTVRKGWTWSIAYDFFF